MEGRDFGDRPSKWRCGRVLLWKIPEFCWAGRARPKRNIFAFYRKPFNCPVHSLQETVLPQIHGKPRLWRCAFCWSGESVTRHTLGDWRSLKCAEKWSHDHHENWKFANRYTWKFHLFKKCYPFRSMTKIIKLSGKKPFHNNGITRRLWRFQHATVLERSIGFSLTLSIYKVVYTRMKDLHAGFVVKLVKTCGFGLVEMALVMMSSRPYFCK